MSNTPGSAEVPTVVIGDVTADSMKVTVNGEVKEIKNGLEELKSLLQKLSTENFTSGNKIYNIGTITNAVFSAEIGKKTFNMYLCRKLTEALRDYSKDAKAFLDNMKEADRADWETQSRYTRKANGYIISGFVGVLGILLQKLISSGKDAFSFNQAKDYLEVCIATAKRTLQLLCYCFVSKLWDCKNESACELSRSQLNIIDNFFNTEIELSITDYVELFNTLVTIFDEKKIAYPFTELNNECLKSDSDFIKSCRNLEEINNKLDRGQVTLSTAFEAENELTTFLCTLNFLAAYKMVSMKDIRYEDIRNQNVQYLHSYTYLGVDNDDKLFSSKFKYDAKPISSDAVLIFKTKYQEGLNLFPFIIDVNALTNEMEVKICFYTYSEEGKKRLIYSDINKVSSDKNDNSKDVSDPSMVVIQYNDEVEIDLNVNTDNDITRLMKDARKYNELQLNMVYKIFENAKREILD